jgi:DNA-binding transcriptional LysR family regulator
MATQSTEGQFTAGLREMAKTLGVIFSPILSCQSFPQSLAAVISGRFAAFVPELAVRDLPADSVRRINGDELRVLDREAMLTWNPRFLRIIPSAVDILTLQ